MSKNSYLSSSSDEDGISLKNSYVATTSKATPIKKAEAVVADPDPESESSDSGSEELVATKKAKASKKKSTKKAAVVVATKKAAVLSKPSTPAKRVAVVSADEPSAKKGKSSGLIQKIWRDDDEVTVLRELVKYRAEKGESAPSDIKGFHAVVKDALVGDFNRKQLGRKVRLLKDKYKTSSGKKNLTPHEEELMKLSKRIWGANSEDDDDAAEDAAAEDAAAEDDADAENDDADDNETNNVCKTKKELKFIGKKSIAMGLDANTVNVGLERCSDAVKVGIEEEWEQFHLEEAALFQKQIKLAIKESNCIVQALKK